MKKSQPERDWLSIEDIHKDQRLKTSLKLHKDDVKLLEMYAMAYRMALHFFNKTDGLQPADVSIAHEDKVRFNEARGCTEFHRSQLPEILAEARALHAGEKRGIQ